MRRTMLWLLPVLAIVGCGSESPAPVAPLPLLPPVPLAPAAGTRVAQTTAFEGCPMDGSGWPFGSRIVFEWRPAGEVKDVVGYDVLAQHAEAANPIVRAYTTDTRYVRSACGSYVVDPNLAGWTWQVRAVGRSGEVSAWSTPTAFGFAPCRVGGRFCGAP
ncbi:MAG: hypothetical protein ABW221_14760 [Vicinamibacteria bacterium]